MLTTVVCLVFFIMCRDEIYCLFYGGPRVAYTFSFHAKFPSHHLNPPNPWQTEVGVSFLGGLHVLSFLSN